jgi:hypothetical protein
MTSRVLSIAEGQLIDRHIFQGRNEFRLKRQDFLEMLVRLLPTSGGG